jgi:glucoamylase
VTILLLPPALPRARAADLEQWLRTEKSTATKKLLADVLGNGAVIASPSKDNPNYYFHRVRDAALTADVLVSLYTGSTDPAERQRYSTLLSAYREFSLANQVTDNPSSAFGRGLGEPKFNTDGSAFRGPWGRPQDDGPALRALTFIRLANYLLDGGDATQIALVKTKLYDSTLPTNSLIKRDLEYVSHNWPNTSFDLWEEVRGNHFYTRMVQRKALVEGAKLAGRLNDGGAAAWYKRQAAALENAIRNHWDPSKGILAVTLNRDGGLDYKSSGLDSSVVLAVLHTHTPGDNFFAPTDDMVLATAARLTSSFEQIYAINKTKQDPAGRPLGTATGRYPEDRYGGQAGAPGGNPWVLCTTGMAELYYRAANGWERAGRIQVTDRTKGFLVQLNPSRFGSLQPGQVLTRNDPAFPGVLAELRAAGDRQLQRVQYHAFPDGSLSEQMNRDTGFMQSAGDLTWNYASVLTTLAQRNPAPAGVSFAVAPAAFPSRGDSLNRDGILLVGAPAVPPANRLNRGGTPVKETAPGVGLPGKGPGPTRGARPNTPAELSERVRELKEAVEALSRDVQALRAGKEGPAPN